MSSGVTSVYCIKKKIAAWPVNTGSEILAYSLSLSLDQKKTTSPYPLKFCTVLHRRVRGEEDVAATLIRKCSL